MPAAPAAPVPAARTGSVVWRVLVCLVVTAVALVAAAGTLLVAVVTWTDCFVECVSPDREPVQGFALCLLASAFAAAGPLLAAALFGSRRWLQASGWVFGIALVLSTVAASSG